MRFLDSERINHRQSHKLNRKTKAYLQTYSPFIGFRCVGRFAERTETRGDKVFDAWIDCHKVGE